MIIELRLMCLLKCIKALNVSIIPIFFFTQIFLIFDSYILFYSHLLFQFFF